MNDEKKRQMTLLYWEGKTYQEIGDIFGVSRQRVFQIIGQKDVRKFTAKCANRCIYTGLREWLIDNKVSLNELTRKIYGYMHPTNWQRTMDRISGKTEINKSFIDKILEITGLTYEEAFGQKDLETHTKEGEAL